MKQSRGYPHKIVKFKPFENGWVDEPISIGLNLVSLEFIPWIRGEITPFRDLVQKYPMNQFIG